MYKRSILLISLLWVIFSVSSIAALAQDSEPAGPVYVVQSGDTLWDIARRFGVSLDELVIANGLQNANAIKAGDELVIPGLPGVSGRLETHMLELGETLDSLSREFQVPKDLLARLNRLLSPAEMYVGMDVIIPVQESENGNTAALGTRLVLPEGQSVLELAVLNGANPWRVALKNGFNNTTSLLPGDILRGDTGIASESSGVGGLLPQISQASLAPLPLVQGKTAEIRLKAPAEWVIQGQLMDRSLNFFFSQEGEWIALQGVHAMSEPGLYPLVLTVIQPDGSNWSISQRIRVIEGLYPFDPELIVDPATIDPEVTQPENEQWAALMSPVTMQKLWDGMFSSPVDRDFSDCWPSTFGNRRSYNDSGYLFFHTGLDFCGAVGNAIYAPAIGEVVFQGPLTVRGNATVINHGWGVYSAYMHQSEILVQVGDQVSVGQLIGRVGNTGRVTGPHLHLELWVGGIQVDPLEWLQKTFP